MWLILFLGLFGSIAKAHSICFFFLKSSKEWYSSSLPQAVLNTFPFHWRGTGPCMLKINPAEVHFWCYAFWEYRCCLEAMKQHCKLGRGLSILSTLAFPTTEIFVCVLKSSNPGCLQWSLKATHGLRVDTRCSSMQAKHHSKIRCPVTQCKIF